VKTLLRLIALGLLAGIAMAAAVPRSRCSHSIGGSRKRRPRDASKTQVDDGSLTGAAGQRSAPRKNAKGKRRRPARPTSRLRRLAAICPIPEADLPACPGYPDLPLAIQSSASVSGTDPADGARLVVLIPHENLKPSVQPLGQQ
jgi:hypothetical protein